MYRNAYYVGTPALVTIANMFALVSPGHRGSSTMTGSPASSTSPAWATATTSTSTGTTWTTLTGS